MARGDLIASVKGKQQKVSFRLSGFAQAREGYRSYASSFAHELAMQSDQIGRLIGHGPTVGSEREELLRALIERHVPRRFHAATGFVEGSERQVDILIYDQVDYAPLFRTGNLVVVPVEAVRALIEVKSTLTSDDLKDALSHLGEANTRPGSGPPIFRGVFAYKGANAPTLIDTLVEQHRMPEGPDDDLNLINSIYDMVSAICILRKSIIVTGFAHIDRGGHRVRAPGVTELASEAGRDTQAALFFDRLLRFLRHPFEGALSQRGYGDRFAVEIASRSSRLLYPDQDWGPYVIDMDVERVEAQIAAYEAWLGGAPWQEPTPDADE